MAAHRRTHAEGPSAARTGRHPTALGAPPGVPTSCRSVAGRAHAGANRAALLTHREADRGKPLVRSAAFAANAAEDALLLRCHGRAQGRRTCPERDAVFPDACPVVIEALRQVFEQAAETRLQPMRAEGRLRSQQPSRAPIRDRRTHGLDAPFTERTGAPHRRLGHAVQDRRTHGQTRTRVLEVPGAPLEHTMAARALTLASRQRNTRLVSAPDYRAASTSRRTSRIATCLQAGVNALESLIAWPEPRPAGCGHPAAWRPWHDHANRAPPEPRCVHSSALPACWGVPFHRTMPTARADRRVRASCVVGHQVKRPGERRWVQRQQPWPS
jgi:hypothetical protein